ncbi:MAG TPA: response regulator [Coriobacteriia bacterium]
MRILVVDDDESGRYLAATILKGYGHEVLEAVDGLDAIAVGRREHVDVVLTDILMPTMDGYALCRAWKADADLSKTPLVFYTATYTEPEDERFAMSIGADAFVTKPQEPQRLVELIAEVVGEQARGDATPRSASETDETQVLREYNERLVSKLERKVLEADKANDDLRAALEVLSDEVEVKKTLIEKLTTDVEEEKGRAADLTKVNQLLETVVSGSPVPVILIDADLHVKVWNPAAERVFGVTAEEVAITELQFAEGERPLIEALLGGELDGTTRDGRRSRRDGTVVEFTASITATRGVEGPTGFVVVVLDWREAAADG